MASASRESLPAPPSLRLMHTNVSQPSITRTQSQQSFAASEDYYSLSSRSSGRSGSHRSDHLASGGPPPRSPTRPHVERFVTAPQHYRPEAPPRVSYEGIATPVAVRQVEQARITPMRGVGRRRVDEVGIEGARRTSPVRRKPVPSTVYEESPRSTTRYTSTPVASSAMKEIAREPSPPTPEASDAPYIHFALDQITNDPNEKGERQPFPQPDEDKPDLGPWMFEKEDPLRSHPLLPRDAASPPIPPRSSRRSTNNGSPDHPLQPDHLVPFDPPVDSFHEPLTALPSTLQPIRLGLFIALLAFYLACLIFVATWSRVQTGLWQYGGFGDGRYFLWQYLPTLFGMALLLWLFEIQSAIYRVAPFMALTSRSANSRGHAVFLPLAPSNFLLPTPSHLLTGQPVFTIFLSVSWLNLLTVPLLSSALNVYFRDGQWVWLATQGVIWTVIALYMLLLAAALALLIYLHRRQTGLKWDARSLADLITIIQASNTLESYANYPIFTGEDEVRERIEERGDALGYFQSSTRPSEIFHTIAAPDRQVRRAAAENARRSQERLSRLSSQIDPESGRPYSEYSTATHATTDPVLPQDMAASWQSRIPWFMRTSFVALWLIAAIVLLLAFLIVSYLPSTRISNGFLPELSVIQSNFGFSAANFLYSFIPSFLALLCLLLWQPFDLAFRRLQTYASLCNAGGEVAEKSLLLSYSADAPILVTIKAMINRHLRVAHISFVTLIAATLPILAGGVFWSQFSISEQRVRIYAHMPAYYALTVLFTIYCLSYAILFGGPSRRLPNDARSLADVIAFVHQSKILDDFEFRAPATRIALVTRLISAHLTYRPMSQQQQQQDPEKLQPGPYQPGLPLPQIPASINGSRSSLADSLRGIGQARRDAESERRFSGAAGVAGGNMVTEQPRYGFGRYIGRDGREWLGIDKIGRPGRGGEMVVRES